MINNTCQKNNLTESVVVEHTPEEKILKKILKNITGFEVTLRLFIIEQMI